MAGTRNVLRGDRKVSDFTAVRQIRDVCTHSMPFFRLREAIECLKRALIGADPLETSINLKLAKLHNDLEEWAEAAAYHRRVVEVCRANGRVFCLHETMYVPD